MALRFGYRAVMSFPKLRWPWVGAATGISILLFHNIELQPWTLDDSYISYRYAENFALGNGFVYNAGEVVEGYTTFLWVFLLGVGNLFGLPSGLVAKGLGLLFGVGTVALVSQSFRLLPDISPRASGVSAALLGSCGVFSAWAMPGMEVPLVALLLTMMMLLFLREASCQDTPVWGAVAALALMARPDTIVLVGYCAVASALLALKDADRRYFRGVALVTILYVPYFLWRFYTYGWLLPNTFYAKVGMTTAQLWRGGEYLLGAMEPSLAIFVQVQVGVLLRLDRTILFLGGGLILHALYVLTVGGDVMPAYRFFAGVLPLAALTAGIAIDAAPWRLFASTYLFFALIFNLWQFEHHEQLRPRMTGPGVGEEGEEVGRWLAGHVAPTALLATNTAGSVPYFSRLATIDMLGLNDVQIAHSPVSSMGHGLAGHEKADGAYVLRRSPDIVQFGSALGRELPGFRSDQQLAKLPGFKEHYVYRAVRLPSGRVAHFWVKQAFIDAGGWAP